MFTIVYVFWLCLGGESHTRPLPLQGNALLLSYPGICIFFTFENFSTWLSHCHKSSSADPYTAAGNKKRRPKCQ